MTRTAISPRLAIRTLLNMVALWLAHRLGRMPLRRDRFNQPLAGRTSPRRSRRRDRRGGRSPDRRTGSIGAKLDRSAGLVAADVDPAAAPFGAGPAASGGGGRGLGRGPRPG